MLKATQHLKPPFLYRCKIIGVFLALFLPISGIFAQVSGTVTTPDGDPMIGVTVLVKNSSNGTVTDIDGKYSIGNTSASDVLIFSFIGYTTIEESIAGRNSINIVLAEDAEALEEVVVVGYGTQKRTSITGAVSSVQSKDIKALPVGSVTQAIQGRVPGVSITNGGSPGSDPRVRIRGIGSISIGSDPLYVVDGVPQGALNNIDPKDIESIEVLKDAASAAIYGSRAANGVVLITTKTGKAGKVQINFDTYYGTQSAWKTLDLLNSEQYRQYGTALLTASGQPIPGRFNNMDVPIYEGATTTFAQTDTDWQDVMFNPAGMTDNQLSLSGGNERSRFYTSIGYFKQDGIMPFTSFDRKSFRVNSDHKINKYFSFGQTLMATTTKRVQERAGGGRSLLMNTMRMTPYWPVTDPTKVGGYSTTAQGLDATDPENPMRIADQEQKDQIDNGVKLVGTLFTDIKFTDYLTYRFTAGGDFAYSRFSGFLPIYNDGNRSRLAAQLNDNRGQFFSSVFTNSLTFNKTFNKHSVNVLGVAERQNARNISVNAGGQRPDNNIKTLNGTSNPTSSSNLSENVLFSYVGRLNYAYDDKYLLGASVRRDGSSKFAPGRKWGTFPAISLGWRVSEESFMEDVTAISELKIRGSYGQSGNNGLGDYQWQPLVQANNTQYPFNNTATLGSYFNSLGNTALSWEVTTMTNIGVDLSVFDSKFDLSAEFYERYTDGLLLNVPVPLSIGYSGSPLANVGAMRNKGFETALTYNFRKGDDFNFALTGTFDITRNNVESLATPNATIDGGANADFGGFAITRTQVGEPINSFFGWQVAGIFQSQAEIDALNAKATDGGFYINANTRPGDIKFADLNGDGKITADDRTFLGSILPKFSYGLNWAGNFKNFDFTMYLQGVQGNKVYNGTKVIGQGMLRLFNATTDVLNAWTPTNTDTDVPRAISGDPNGNARTSDRFLEDGSYMRIKNLSIGYTFPASSMKNLTGNVVERLRVYVSSQNLLTLTKYTGYDPEIVGGVDFGTYPQARTILFGLNLGF
ncbi:MAG: TonB-dependent receptor [Saprospiraceae bacterium]|nr:TonB-dependent receptor [Saprospiraceae bacterium]